MSSTTVNRNSKVVKSDDQARSLLSKLQELYERSELVDTTLITETDKVTAKAHRIVLSASSDYFLALFCSSMNEATTGRVELQNVTGSTLKSILDFMYSATIELNCSTVEGVLRAADLLQMSNLIDICCDFMQEQLEPCNCLGVALLAEEYGYVELQKKSLDFAYANFEKVSSEQEFLRLDEDRLNQFLCGNDLNVASQEKLFLNLVAWFKHDERNREAIICSLLSQHVRHQFLEIKFIVESKEQLGNIPQLSELLHSWLERHLLSERSIPQQTNKIVFIYRGLDNFKFNVQIYNPELDSWSHEDWPSPSRGKTKYGMFLTNNKFIISGGVIKGRATNRVECLDLDTMEWNQLPSMGTARVPNVMAEINGDLYVVGSWKVRDRWSQIVERYICSARKWQRLAPLPLPVAYPKVAVLNGLLYVSGEYQYHLECYDPATNSWSQTASKNEKSFNFGLASLGGYLYAVGGEFDSRLKTKTVEQYDPSNNTWTVVQSLKEGRSMLSCAVWNDRLYVYGGWENYLNFSFIFEEYNPQTNEWKTLTRSLHCNKFDIFSAHLAAL